MKNYFPPSSLLVLACLSLSSTVHAHGHIAFEDDANVDPDATYAQKHMAQEHHIDAFDMESLHKLHDLNRDGVLDYQELEALYGIHHETSRSHSGDTDSHEKQAQEIMRKVMAAVDKNKDGVVTVRELVEAGPKGLPDFPEVKGLGHHYDEESEFYIHHEEKYHNTAETQGEEAYIHPEDLAHFAAHQEIEDHEDELNRKAQGIADPAASPQQVAFDAEEAARRIMAANGNVETPDASVGEKERLERSAEESRRERAFAAARQSFASAREEAARRGSFGSGGEGWKRPKDQAGRMRANVPYKFKVRKSGIFGEF